MRKILKYEFKNYYREFFIMGAIVLIFAVFSSLLLSANFKDMNNQLLEIVLSIVGSITTVLYIFSIFAIFVIWLKLAIDSLYKKLFTNQGYLSFSLPVSIDKLLISKLIACFIWLVYGILILVVSLLLYISIITKFDNIVTTVLLEILKTIFKNPLMVFLICLFIVVSTVLSLILILFVATLMHSNKGNKSFTFISILLYFGLSSAIETVIQIASVFNLFIGFEFLSSKSFLGFMFLDHVVDLTGQFPNISELAFFPYFSFNSFIIYVGAIIGLYFLIRFIISRKLELK